METKSIFTRIALGMVAITLLVSLAACNTVEGAGKDLEKGGEKIQDAAD